MDIALQIVMILGWFDFQDISRGGPVQQIKIVHRPRQTGKAISSIGGQRSDSMVQDQQTLSLGYLDDAAIDHRPVAEERATIVVTRDQVLRLRALLERDHGVEGSKRFVESCFTAFAGTSNQRMADFWSNFRTFLDLEPAANGGFGFDIEHFSHDVTFVNNAQGMRAVTASGMRIGPKYMNSLFRIRREDI